MKTPHKHAEMIKAWADGAEIQHQHSLSGTWFDCEGDPKWEPYVVYRIKPEKPEPYFNQTMDVYMNMMYSHYPSGFTKRRLMIDNFALLGTMNLTFDGTTRKLKSAEVI